MEVETQARTAVAIVLVSLVLGFVVSAGLGWLLHAVGIQGYPWDNPTTHALLTAILLAVVMGQVRRES